MYIGRVNVNVDEVTEISGRAKLTDTQTHSTLKQTPDLPHYMSRHIYSSIYSPHYCFIHLTICICNLPRYCILLYHQQLQPIRSKDIASTLHPVFLSGSRCCQMAINGDFWSVSVYICPLSRAHIQAYIVRDDKTKFSTSSLAGLKSAQISAEHQVIQGEGDDTLPPSTSCFLESEERIVCHSFIHSSHHLSTRLTPERHSLYALI